MALSFRRRQHVRTGFAHPERVRVLTPEASRQLGHLLDASLGGFRARLHAPVAPGDLLDALIEFPDADGATHYVTMQARCVWQRDGENGFVVRDMPLASERAYDWLAENGAAV